VREDTVYFIRLGTCGIGALLVAGTLAAQDVTTDYDKQYDFSQVKTYASIIGTSWNNQLSERRVMASLDSVLQSKGWTKVADSVPSDAGVVIHGGVGKKQDVTTYYAAAPYGRFRWGAGVATVSSQSYEYPYGAMVVDIFDLKTKSMVFRGSAEGEMSNKQEQNQQKLVKAWKKMFKDFPPQQKNK
jgi:uncharacterized protein DUF4136